MTSAYIFGIQFRLAKCHFYASCNLYAGDCFFFN